MKVILIYIVHEVKEPSHAASQPLAQRISEIRQGRAHDVMAKTQWQKASDIIVH